MANLYCGSYVINTLITLEQKEMAIGELETPNGSTFVVTNSNNGSYFWSTYDIETYHEALNIVLEHGTILNIRSNDYTD